ncbi:LysM peptidoglycan-binding domain-containing protein [Bradyrhizobium sp. 186]|uniref:LysM peptidoglycan-binding domain-containing protein n=1 Tax=Bradyrhizobium sp. 186 TaxID=2782654 RepID=UPI00200134CE|nr:LysM peptidoglycan-binding domain-containing protein [Bradyrhizobium sp. 186]UPK35595.1 LysM peptidoglycan-binding domain-containing protein [Bradyrhizobium sp. 186]
MMTASKAFIALCVLAVFGTALVIGPAELRRLLPGGANTEIAVAAKPDARPETRAETKAEANPEPKPEEPKLTAAPKTGAMAETQKQVTAALADLAPVKAPPAATDVGPRFDVARVDDHGEAAVIAGKAAPSAKVELLRDGQPLDSVVADASGLFVMTPSQLPAGSYELTLRATAPDGTVTQSGRTMPVTIAEAAPPPVRPAPAARQAEKPDEKSDVVASLPSAASRVASASAARPRMMGPPKPRVLARAPAETAGATVASASAAEVFGAAPAERGGSRVISRGDSLWALSRLAYGDGARYAVIFKANRDKIHNPNLIYPGQTFVLPQKTE